MGIELKPEIAMRLATLASAVGLSIEDYLQLLLNRELAAQPADRDARQKAEQTILALQKKVKPDPEGWTIRDYINYGRH